MSIYAQSWRDNRTGEVLKVILHYGFFFLPQEDQSDYLKELNEKLSEQLLNKKAGAKKEYKEIIEEEELLKLYKAGYICYSEYCGMDITPQLKKIGIIK